MSKREKMIGAILLGLAIICLFVFRPQGAPAPQQEILNPPGPKSVSTNQTITSVTVPQEYKRMIEKVLIKFEPQEPVGEVADPFKKFEAKELIDKNVLEFTELKLIGIVMDENAPTALINGQILHVGDSVSGFKVADIRSNEVLLTRGLEKYTLKLFEEQ